MPITKVKFENFTAFKSLALDFSPGINVFVGANGTGKTHIMKVAYAACDITNQDPKTANIAEKLVRVFLPSENGVGRLVKRQRGLSRCAVEVCSEIAQLGVSFGTRTKVASRRLASGTEAWCEQDIESVYIPVKEMLSNAPGFLSLYADWVIHFEEVYNDILLRAFRPVRRGPIDAERKPLLDNLKQAMDGTVVIKNQEFFLKNKQGNLEFTLLAEGIRKLGLLWLLIQNGSLCRGSVLFWDEPEANLNPKFMGSMMEILLELQRTGVQVFIATHDYVILKELDLRKKEQDKVSFHALYRDDETGTVRANTTDEFLQIAPNAIQDTFVDLFDREVSRRLKPKRTKE